MKPEATFQGAQNGPAIPSSARRMVVANAMIDVVGFSTLAERDGDALLRRWELLLTESIRPAIKRFHGTESRESGDGVLSYFPSADEALACVVEIQRSFAAEPSEPPILRLRGGINFGSVVVIGDVLFGDAVNVACRLQDLAAPGGILVSAAVEEQVRGRTGEAMEDLGNLLLKNMSPVHAYSLLQRPPSSGLAERPSIAVLPFAESDSPGGGYFGDGIVEDIVDALAAIPELFVASRSSTLAFRSGSANLREVREALGVRYVLSGRVRRAGARTRIATELCDSESLSVLWSDPRMIDRPRDDIFALRDRESRHIVAMIAPHLREAELSRVARKRPENFNAYDYFLRGLELVYRLDDDFHRADAEFEKALELDPQYAAPYAYRALWHAVRIGQGWSANVEADRQDCRRFAEKAIARDDLDATSLALCGHVLAIQWQDFAIAFPLFERALPVSPSSAIAWTRSSPAFSYVGDWKEGRRRAKEGLRLSPLDRHLFFTHTALGRAAHTGQEYDETIDGGARRGRKTAGSRQTSAPSARHSRRPAGWRGRGKCRESCSPSRRHSASRASARTIPTRNGSSASGSPPTCGRRACRAERADD